ncbi:hypothetical protein ACQV2Z_15955, partial [Klebsiella pneumoniae]|uniref:hypothetical protein n=1 Tax=Klebsiella pneumoniae TaxID=573 RepID=UPI003D172F2A
ITPSVAEQEGQQTETEATGAPQKHHYTLNQQVGSITRYSGKYALKQTGGAPASSVLRDLFFHENPIRVAYFIKKPDPQRIVFQ